MSNIICVTNRKLCCKDFLTRLEEIAKLNIDAIVLREKDLSEEEYYKLTKEAIDICSKYSTQLILHNYPNIAKKLGYEKIHLPLNVLKGLSAQDIASFDVIGASCHSVDDAILAQKLGCTYIFAGHIFLTDCKKGLAGRGLDFLNEVCKNVDIPVYAIGGISGDKYASVIDNGAKGCAIMSGLMACSSPEDYLSSFEV